MECWVDTVVVVVGVADTAIAVVAAASVASVVAAAAGTTVSPVVAVADGVVVVATVFVDWRGARCRSVCPAGWSSFWQWIVGTVPTPRCRLCPADSVVPPPIPVAAAGPACCRRRAACARPCP